MDYKKLTKISDSWSDFSNVSETYYVVTPHGHTSSYLFKDLETLKAWCESQVEDGQECHWESPNFSNGKTFVSTNNGGVLVSNDKPLYSYDERIVNYIASK